MKFQKSGINFLNPESFKGRETEYHTKDQESEYHWILSNLEI